MSDGDLSFVIIPYHHSFHYHWSIVANWIVFHMVYARIWQWRPRLRWRQRCSM